MLGDVESTTSPVDLQQEAKWAFDMADAMLAEAKKREKDDER